MAKKVANLEKLKIEIELQKSKLRSLALLDKELEAKIARLSNQRSDLNKKAQKLKYVIQQNEQRLNGSK